MKAVTYNKIKLQKIKEVKGEGGEPFTSFLLADFNQCFKHMRHCDSQLTLIVKFVLSGYTALFAGAFALYKIFKDNPKVYTFLTIFLLFGFLASLLLYTTLIRNRAYFVIVARYVNSIRNFYLSKKPLGFVDPTDMYVSHNVPFFNPRSFHSLILYFVSFLNSATLTASIYFYKISIGSYMPLISITVLIFIVSGFQIWFAIKYLKSRQNKSADKAIFEKGG